MRKILIGLSMLLAFASIAQADDKVEHGDWSSQFMEDMGEATTHENGMATFGMLCAKGSCRYYFANGTECAAGSAYPLMVTTNEGAMSVNAVCEPMASANGDIMLYWFDEEDAINAAFNQTTTVGFAFPLTNGQFKLSNFSMDGFNAAIARMIRGVQDRGQSAGMKS
jgi:hypothetical protein